MNMQRTTRSGCEKWELSPVIPNPNLNLNEHCVYLLVNSISSTSHLIDYDTTLVWPQTGLYLGSTFFTNPYTKNVSSSARGG